ncbi:ABC transporter substrate-binding protein [Pseudoroseicyclus sp. CLL3-39]|uniref:ABC transporter substrate-binding protein n=1 Tax=Pseudoroseicyclus tamaricis TaxID=2705421 RepID=A0A6B2K1J4_9RHOB|nr:ABC transporter substrate-binding protein [Pseudoroseicyclus tamaricis]
MTRRTLLASAAALGLTAPLPAFAVTQQAATQLVGQLVAEVNAVIASGQPEGAMLAEFERIFLRHADVPTIAAYVLGPARRAATPAQMQAFMQAYSAYVARKYGGRFREFIGGEVEVVTARDLPRGVEVETRALLRGQSPFRVDFHVEDSTGRPLFFNLIIEGVNMLLSERQEVLAMLDARGGSLDRLIADLA